MNSRSYIKVCVLLFLTSGGEKMKNLRYVAFSLVVLIGATGQRVEAQSPAAKQYEAARNAKLKEQGLAAGAELRATRATGKARDLAERHLSVHDSIDNVPPVGDLFSTPQQKVREALRDANDVAVSDTVGVGDLFSTPQQKVREALRDANDVAVSDTVGVGDLFSSQQPKVRAAARDANDVAVNDTVGVGDLFSSQQPKVRAAARDANDAAVNDTVGVGDLFSSRDAAILQTASPRGGFFSRITPSEARVQSWQNSAASVFGKAKEAFTPGERAKSLAQEAGLRVQQGLARITPKALTDKFKLSTSADLGSAAGNVATKRGNLTSATPRLFNQTRTGVEAAGSAIKRGAEAAGGFISGQANQAGTAIKNRWSAGAAGRTTLAKSLKQKLVPRKVTLDREYKTAKREWSKANDAYNGAVIRNDGSASEAHAALMQAQSLRDTAENAVKKHKLFGNTRKSISSAATSARDRLAGTQLGKRLKMPQKEESSTGVPQSIDGPVPAVNAAVAAVPE